MRVLVLGVMLLGLAGCYTMKWSVPPTPEGNACKRDCMIVYNTCMAKNPGNPYAEPGCRKEQDECHSTCPGAKRIGK